MHIAINAQLLNTQASYRSAGVSNYSRNLLHSLGALLARQEEEDHRITAFTNRSDFCAKGVQIHANPLPLHSPPTRIAWEQAVLPRLLHAMRADLVHGLVNVLPLAARLPGVVTVHDLSFLRMPDKFPAAKRAYLARMCRASVNKADHVIAVSRQTAQDLVCFFGTDPVKISVIPNGVDHRFSPGDARHSERFRRSRGLPARFWLYVGTLEPRKNLERLVRAYARWRSQAPQADREVKLVLAGAKGWFYAEIFRSVAEHGLEGVVLFPGYVPDSELPDWYRAAEGFVYPSLYEGFGLPVLEAMSCGTPVLCSRDGSLLEVAGGATLAFPASAIDAWAAGLAMLAGQPALRAELGRRGLARAQQFSWDRTAQATFEVYTAVHKSGTTESFRTVRVE